MTNFKVDKVNDNKNIYPGRAQMMSQMHFKDSIDQEKEYMYNMKIK